MSKPTFSFGLKKAGPAKPAPKLRKPAPFGNDGLDDDEAAPSNTIQVSELDSFTTTTTKTTQNDPPEDGRRKGPNKKPLTSQPPPPPPPPPSTATTTNPFTDLSSALTSRKYTAEADPSIYDYDAAYDSFQAAKAAPRDGPAAAEQKKPRYFAALQRAADVRERDRQIAEERRLQRERAAEGDAFADKEQFVTEAYRRQQEANRRAEAAEAAREEAERAKNRGRGLAAFYQGVLERGEREHAELVKAAEEGLGLGGPGGDAGAEEGEKSAAERAAEINARGGNVLVNEDGEVVDKRQLLRGGLNVAARKKVEVQQEKARQAARPASGVPSKGVYAAGGKQGMRERQTRMLEAQLAETLKRSRHEEEQEAAKVELAAKTRKTDADISSAKERYLARKRAAEEAKKQELAEGP
ncbi:hypothetical protein BT67DRAFT_414545 [Trichocladium antarcticum]|uniref:Nuclear speckle splicing regulatory protein 1 N-terminal domain-containing protein n=1 Tax=Trichocladium antarcticum TaxID=1450529 RepID=A0AAN6ZH44_9PEZI|nr:hypothetical protein BT67DRAFT_414545 [Trichocladium antarcticum]